MGKGYTIVTQYYYYSYYYVLLLLTSTCIDCDVNRKRSSPLLFFEGGSPFVISKVILFISSQALPEEHMQ